MKIMLVLLVLAACDDGDAATAPVISDLTVTPDHVAIGTATIVQGDLRFTDPDGDVATMRVAVMLPDGQRQDLGETAVANARGLTSSQIGWQLQLSPPAAGDYRIELSLVDASGLESNALEAVVTAE